MQATDDFQLKIAVFDSGVGGLSICQEIKAAFLAAGVPVHLLYFVDDAFFPYGEKTVEVVSSRVLDFIIPLVAKTKPDILVIACNTASTIVLPMLRERLTIPVVGVVPAIKPAAVHSRLGCIGLLATPATIQRSYTDDLIEKYAPKVKVFRLGSTRLVEMAEESLAGAPVSIEEVTEIITPFFNTASVDTIVLGCTHFPLLKEAIELAVAGFQLAHAVKLIDSGEAVSRRVIHLLESKIALREVVITDISSTPAFVVSLFSSRNREDLDKLKAKVKRFLCVECLESVLFLA